MILKKPYAFIIKHFRIIHLLLLIPMLYLIFKTKAMVSFFSTYIINDYSLNFNTVLSSLSSEYINVLMYISVLIILITFITMSILLQQKEKPTKFYNISIVYYIFIFILITASFNIFNNIEKNTMDDVVIRLVRDIGYIIHLSQYIFVIFTFIRGIGFNLKKFNFKSDIEELEISKEDSEEFEFLIGKDTYATKRTIRRFFRELKYYYLENKFIFTIIIIIGICILGTTLYMNREVYQKVYKENETFSYGYLNIKVKNSYITNLDYNGKVIKDDKTYVVLKLEVKNRYIDNKDFNYGNFNLKVNKQTILPSIELGNYFKDYGLIYNGGTIKGLSTNELVLVYEIDKYLENAKIKLSAYSHYDNTPGGLGAVSKEINIKPKKVSKNIVENTVGIGTNVNLSNTNLQNTTTTILKYEIASRHEFQVCKSENECITSAIYIDYGKDVNKTLLILDYDLELDPNSSYVKANRDYKSFFEDFLEIKYTYNRKTYRSRIKILNPENYQDKLIMKVSSDISNASNIEAVITIRDRAYHFKLKN